MLQNKKSNVLKNISILQFNLNIFYIFSKWPILIDATGELPPISQNTFDSPWNILKTFSIERNN